MPPILLSNNPTVFERQFRGNLHPTNGSDSKLSKQAKNGILLLIIGLYIAFITAIRPVLMIHGWPISMRLTNHLGINSAFFFICTGGLLYILKRPKTRQQPKVYRLRIKLWFIGTAVFTLFGYLLGNLFLSVVREMMLFTYIGLFLSIGGDDILWENLSIHLTIFFYLGTFLILTHFQTPMTDIPELRNTEIAPPADPNSRFTWSIGYYMRPLLGSGLLLGMLGLIQREMNIGKIFRSLSWLFYFTAEVVVFKFRSPAAYILLSALSFFLIRPYLSYRLRPSKYIFIISLFLLAFWYYTSRAEWDILQDRVTQSAEGVGLFASRSEEFNSFLSDLKEQVLIGRGLGGTFDASKVFPGAINWSTLHTGITIFLLKGGVFFFFLFISFFRIDIFKRKDTWYRDTYNITATLLFPIYCIRFFTVPFSLAPEALFIHIPAMMILSRIWNIQSDRKKQRKLPLANHLQQLPAAHPR